MSASTARSGAGSSGVLTSRSTMTTSVAKARPRATGAPEALKAELRPSKTRSSLPPAWFTYNTGRSYLAAMLPSI